MDNKVDQRWPFCKVSMHLSQSLLTESFRNIITVISFLVFENILVRDVEEKAAVQRQKSLCPL